jgi:hypothetical protein
MFRHTHFCQKTTWKTLLKIHLEVQFYGYQTVVYPRQWTAEDGIPKEQRFLMVFE